MRSLLETTMYKSAAILNFLILCSTFPACAEAASCFDSTAQAAESAVLKELGEKASDVSVYNVEDTQNWNNGDFGPYKGVRSTYRKATGSATVVESAHRGIVKPFEVTVYAKANTCEVLGVEVKFLNGGGIEETGTSSR